MVRAARQCRHRQPGLRALLAAGRPGWRNCARIELNQCGREIPFTVARACTRPNGPVQSLPGQSGADRTTDTSLWRLAARTVVHTALWFMIPYLVAYYSVMGAWQGLRALLLLLARF